MTADGVIFVIVMALVLTGWLIASRNDNEDQP